MPSGALSHGRLHGEPLIIYIIITLEPSGLVLGASGRVGVLGVGKRRCCEA
jgi:hypothetical protein